MSAIRVMVDGKPQWRVELDPYWSLTQRQRQILDTVRALRGNRHAAARQLGITYPAVQSVLRVAARHGNTIPPRARRGPDLTRRINATVPCGAWMPRSDAQCGRRVGHAGHCRVKDRRLAA